MWAHLSRKLGLGVIGVAFRGNLVEKGFSDYGVWIKDLRTVTSYELRVNSGLRIKGLRDYGLKNLRTVTSDETRPSTSLRLNSGLWLKKSWLSRPLRLSSQGTQRIT